MTNIEKLTEYINQKQNPRLCLNMLCAILDSIGPATSEPEGTEEIQKIGSAMIDKRELSMMADIMDGIEQTDEWTEIQMNDPGIKAAGSRWNRAMESAKSYLPREIYDELSDANCNEVSAYSDVAILYGIRVSSVIQTVAANPSQMTRFWLDRRLANS